jgi:preprotein translocase subunit SecG
MNFTVPLLILHVIAAVSIILLVLLQHGKGADMGAAFGSGSAGSVFGSSGSANFLSRSTSIAAAAFFITSIALTYVGAQKPGGLSQGVMKSLPAAEVKADAKKDETPANAAIPAPVAVTPAPAAGTPAVSPASATPAVPVAPAAPVAPATK